MKYEVILTFKTIDTVNAVALHRRLRPISVVFFS